MKVTLNILDGKTKALIKTFSILISETGITIGRTNSTVNILDKLASRRHAGLRSSSNEELILEDLGSRNGSFVNGSKIKAIALKQGDEFTIGNVKFLVEAIDKNILSTASSALNANPKITRSTGEWIKESTNLPGLSSHPLSQEPVATNLKFVIRKQR